ncbi:MAG TPA: hypothetical protein VFS29_10340 [Motilibacteraceae bacterium]|nr:hypothetical protein [Motilibacteraceae bacterium]
MTNSAPIQPAPRHPRLAAGGLVAGALLFTVGDLLRRLVVPAGAPSAADVTAAVARHDGAWLAAGLLSLAAAFALLPGLTALVAAARGRGAQATTVGGLMVAAGALASVGHAVAFYSPYALFHRAGASPADVAAIDQASEAYPMLVVLIVLFMVGMVIGPVVLFVGLRRARRVPVWAVVAAVVFVASGSTGGVLAGVVGILAALAAFGPAARSLLMAPPAAAAPSPRVPTPAAVGLDAG